MSYLVTHYSKQFKFEYQLIKIALQMQFIHHKIHPCKVYKSVVFSIFMALFNHHYYLIAYHLHHPRKKPCTRQCSPSFPPPSIPWQPIVCFPPLWICLFWTFYINGIIQHVAFCVWLPSLSVRFSRFIHIGVFINLIPFMAE